LTEAVLWLALALSSETDGSGLVGIAVREEFPWNRDSKEERLALSGVPVDEVRLCEDVRRAVLIVTGGR